MQPLNLQRQSVCCPLGGFLARLDDLSGIRSLCTGRQPRSPLSTVPRALADASAARVRALISSRSFCAIGA
jgi:hypothetical protein